MGDGRMAKESGKGSSIKSVASAAGVSVATVSRVLNDKGYVSPDTEKKVRKAIEECQYTPNLAARGLRTNHMPLIGCILPNIRNEYFSSLASVMQERMLKYGYFLIFCLTKHTHEVEVESARMLISQNVAGVVMIAGRAACRMIPGRIPTVGIDCFPRPEALGHFAVVHSDDEEGGYLATRELLDKGCRRIAIFAGFRDGYTHQQRLAGYRRALEERGLQLEPEYVFFSNELTYEDGKRLVNRLLRSEIDFDGIFGISDHVLQGSISELMRNGVQIPGQVKIVGFDDSTIAERGSKKLTTIHRPTDQIAEMTTKLLISMIAGKPAQDLVYTAPVRLVVRETTENEI